MKYREIFLMHNGPEPWTCFRCGEEIDYVKLHVHHADGDHSNNTVENLVAVTSSCHRKLHNVARRGVKRGPNKKREYVFSDEHRAAISAAQRARFERDGGLSDETRVKMSAAAKGRKRTPEHQEKLNATHRGTKRSAESRARMSEAAKKRWANA